MEGADDVKFVPRSGLGSLEGNEMDISWTRLGLTVLAAGIVCSLTDWLFMGDWIYKRFDVHPEIWR